MGIVGSTLRGATKVVLALECRLLRVTFLQADKVIVINGTLGWVHIVTITCEIVICILPFINGLM